MALDLSAIATKSAVATVEFMGQTATVLYNPSLLTEENVSKAQNSEEEFIAFFTDVVKDWDIKRGPKKVPITEKSLRSLPLPLLRAIFRTVLSSSGAEEQEGKNSSVG